MVLDPLKKRCYTLMWLSRVVCREINPFVTKDEGRSRLRSAMFGERPRVHVYKRLGDRCGREAHPYLQVSFCCFCQVSMHLLIVDINQGRGINKGSLTIRAYGTTASGDTFLAWDLD
jgi:hypothetical protein